MPEVSSTVGISDIGLYVPPPVIDLENLVQRRVRLNPRLDRHLERARRVTGQKSIRFPEIWEDSATMAASAIRLLVRQNPGIDLKSVRHLAVGTETGVDHSKPVSAYAHGMLQRAGIELPGTLSSFQVQHACPGGTMALLGVAAMLATGGRPADSGIVASSDVARYETESTAEITQGAGAVALHVQNAPRLLELDLATIGYCSADVDDFFRPLGSITARVNGKLLDALLLAEPRGRVHGLLCPFGCAAGACAAGRRLFRPAYAVSQHARDGDGKALRKGAGVRRREDAQCAG